MPKSQMPSVAQAQNLLLRKQKINLRQRVGVMIMKLNLSTILAAALTYFLNFNLGLGPFAASALTGLTAAKLLPKFAAPIYAASFASMSSVQVLPNIILSVFAGLFTGLIYLSAQKAFLGLGGKLGAIAFFSALAVAWNRAPAYLYSPLPLPEVLYLILASCFGAGFTYYLSVRFKQNSVFSSGVIVLIAAFLGYIFLGVSQNVVAAATCGSYAGMSSREVITDIKKMYLVGLAAGVILFLTWPLFCGVGGKLGLVAFLAVFFSKLIIRER